MKRIENVYLSDLYLTDEDADLLNIERELITSIFERAIRDYLLKDTATMYDRATAKRFLQSDQASEWLSYISDTMTCEVILEMLDIQYTRIENR